MTVRRSRVVRAPSEKVWEVVGDPHHLPRWWPRVGRVEGVTEDAWTTVLGTDKGRGVRADYSLTGEDPGRRRAWTLQVEDTPFERLFREQVTEVRLDPAGDGTQVEIEVRQRGRGFALFGGFMLRRATRRNLDEALSGLAEVVEVPA